MKMLNARKEQLVRREIHYYGREAKRSISKAPIFERI